LRKKKISHYLSFDTETYSEGLNLTSASLSQFPVSLKLGI